VVGSGHAFVDHPESANKAEDVGVLAAQRHEIDQRDDIPVNLEACLKDQRPWAISATNAARLP
jgi:hypothetical protein